MATQPVDVVVLGMGVGGEDAAGRLAEAGLAVVGIDDHLVGGECPYYGCIPSKMMIRAADALMEGRRVPLLAGSSTITPDWTPVHARIRDEATDDWDDRAAVERFEGKGGRFVRGKGVIVGPGRVAVGDDVFEAGRAVVLATGTSPSIPPIPGLSDVPYWTNREIVRSTVALPSSLVVLGGGSIGVELAQAVGRFGTRVMIVEAAERLLPHEEPETGTLLATVLRREGIELHLAAEAERVRAGDGGIEVELGAGTVVSGERLLVATGRTPNVRDIGLDSVGLDETARPTITVDEHMRVKGASQLWAIGDVAGLGAFTHMAVYESGVAVEDILGRADGPVAERHAISRVTFTDPEIGAVGLTEAQAREAGIDVHLACAPGETSSRGWIHGPGNDGFIKLVEDAERGVLVGATVAGPRGGEVLSMFNVAVHARLPTDTLRTMIYAYPTFYRGALDALAGLAD
jgi:pyruvate/2-oxoglutarate dehydrogenase complex dihydrolipoamide dehydrogenase (E3) component